MPSGQSQSAPSIPDAPWNEQPYTAPPPPQLPEITAPPTRPESETKQPQAPSVARSGGGLATVAFGLDSILKGYMRGREQAQQQKAYKAKQLAGSLRYNYDVLAQNYLSLVQSGAEEKDIQAADLGQRAAYQKLMEMQRAYTNPPSKKKSKGGGQSSGTNGQQEDPLQLMASKDPVEKARGLSLFQNKIFDKYGTPANAMARPYLSPEYRKQRELMQGQQATEATVQQVQQQQALHQKSLGDIQSQIDKIATVPEAQRTPEQTKQLGELEKAKKVMTGSEPEVQSRKAMIDAAVEDVTKMNGGKPPTPEQYERILEAAGEIKAAPAEGDLIPFFSGDKFIGSMHRKTGEFVPPPAQLSGSKVSTKPGNAGAGGGKPQRVPVYNSDRSLAGEWFVQADGKQTYVPAPGQPATPPSQAYNSGGAPEEVDMLKKARGLRLAANQAKKLVANPTPTNAQALVYAYVRGNVAGAGRMTQAEIVQAAKAGSFETRVNNWITTAFEGHPDKKFMEQMAATIETEAAEAERLANEGRGGGSGSGGGGTSPSNPSTSPSSTPASSADDFIKKHGG